MHESSSNHPACVFGGLIGLLLYCLVPLTANGAAILFEDDFQDGEAEGWTASGKGDVRLTRYQGNVSMRLTRTAAVVTRVSTRGFEDIRIALSFAASSLEAQEQCLGEVSADGVHWYTVNRVGSDRADAVTLYPGTLTLPELADRDSVYIGARVTGNRDDDTCWLDNVRVSGSRISSDANGSGFRAQQLIDGVDYPAPVDTSFFAPSGKDQPSVRNLTGRLRISGHAEKSRFRVVRDTFGLLIDAPGRSAVLPSLELSVVQQDRDLLPVTRTLLETSHPDWNVIFSPGRVWDDPNDENFSRAALPFALQEKNRNCVHNGLMTFLIDSKGVASHAAYQIGSETCPYRQFDAWGFLDVEYLREDVPEHDATVAAWEEEQAAWLPVRPITEIDTVYPGVDSRQFASPNEVAPDALSTFGVVADGVHYAGHCPTRYGDYPYCNGMVLPAYSTAKSVFAALLMFRLEKAYPGIGDRQIVDLVPECAATGKWKGVSLWNLLDMNTGLYQSRRDMKDEDGSAMAAFFDATTRAEKLALACDIFPRRARPGRHWVYHTSDTWILGVALQNYLRRHSQAEADIYRDWLVPLWRELGLSPVMMQSLRTRDETAQPYVGLGLFYTRNDVARLAWFLNPGRDRDPAIFDRKAIRMALQKDPDNPGLRAGTDDLRYQHGFWASRLHAVHGCKPDIWIPFMSGYGGITIALMPGGVSYYYFSDGNDYRWDLAARETGRIRSFCSPPGGPETQLPTR